MARQRRGGFRPPELRGTLGTLLNTALQQAGVVRDALERGARQGRSRFDEVRSNRRRHDALAELGEIVLDLIRRGEIDVTELPEAQDVVQHLEELDAEEAPRARRNDRGDRDDDIAQPATRSRFDERAVAPARTDEDDGTVSATRWKPKAAASQQVWRPPADVGPAPLATEPGRRAALPRDPLRKGGIAFEDDDEDLADYMHPDDLPPKPGDS